jgi:hypothetical protein
MTKQAHKKVRVFPAVKAAIKFALASAPRVWGVLAAVVVFNIAAAVATPLFLKICLTLAAALIGLMAQAALFRLDFAQGGSDEPEFKIGPGGFQWREPETRLLGASLLLAFLFSLGFLFWIVIAIFGVGTATVVSGQGGAAPGSPPPESAQLVVGVLALILLGAGIWVGVRVSLYQAATVASRKIMVFSTWHLTKGNFWAILAASIILLLPELVLTFGARIPNLPTGVALGIALVLGVVIAFVELPLMCGLNAHLYALLKDEGEATAGGSVPPSPGQGPWG